MVKTAQGDPHSDSFIHTGTKRTTDVRLAAVDLFAGAGGFGLGVKMAGFSVDLAVEVDAWACDTLRANHRGMEVIQGDITQLKEEGTLRSIIGRSPQLIIGGPPCQGFSIAGPAKKDPSDPRNSLFMSFVRWVEILQPKAFVMENVKGLLSRRSAAGKPVIKIIRDSFAEKGYNVEVWCLRAADYGVPQLRERIFVVGHQGKGEIGAPPPTHIETERASLEFALPGFSGLPRALTLWDAISDLPMLNAGEGHEEQPYLTGPENAYQEWSRGLGNTLYNHVAMSHSKRLVERFRHIQCGQSINDVPVAHGAQRRNGNGELSAKGGYDQNNRRLRPNKPSHTIAASFYANFLHPFQHRNLTAREGARVQSFPDSYRFMGKKTVVSQKLLHREERYDEKFLCQYNQVGNAVPPLLAKAVAEHIRQSIFP